MRQSIYKIILRTSVFGVLSLLLSLTPGCTDVSSLVKSDPGTDEADILFTDPDRLFSVRIPAELTLSKRVEEGAKIYEFRRSEDPDTLQELIRFSVRKVEAGADLFNPGYEAEFLSRCRCSILERGVVNFLGRPARQYMVSVRNGVRVGFQRHLALGTKVILLDVRGPREEQAHIRALFERIISSFQLLNQGLPGAVLLISESRDPCNPV